MQAQIPDRNEAGVLVSSELQAGIAFSGNTYEIRVNLPVEVMHAAAEAISGLENWHKQRLLKIAAPAILVARFHAREEMEGTLLRWINRIIGTQEGFQFAFNNYGSMPKQPLYWRIQDKGNFRQLTERLRVLDGWMQGNGCGALRLIHSPRLLLVEEMDSSVERQIQLEFSSRCHHLEMELRELELMRCDAWSNKFQLVSRFPLLPPGFKQPERFI
ncbi:hypothetical protein [Flavihumibacter sp. UBA7668]|uniref:hypothetical protein n=1 Tax=Flavihumibacter sp. UBA7668 TaxID=1946542 RepID=UPI0025BD26A4|nr:hypothetical protein [Flavihumibacter sp. UBA7668]